MKPRCLFANAVTLILAMNGAAQSARAGSLPFEESLLYTASDSTEAVLTFEGEVEFTTTRAVDPEVVREKIRLQVAHLFGSMAEASTKAVPRGNEKISRIEVLRKPGVRSGYVARYAYRGTIVVQQGRDAKSSTYDVVLPINPDRIFQAARVTRTSGSTFNPCTDPHYQAEGDFWYFWNPYKAGCRLKEGVDFRKIEARVERLENTETTFPEYDRLVDSTGTIRIHVLMGMDDPTRGKNPLVSADLNASNYRGIREVLVEKWGFSGRRLSSEEIAVVAGVKDPVAFVEEFSRQTPRGQLLVTLFFGPSGIDEQSGAFHHFYRDAIERASVMIYDGHSGLGGHLDLAAIEEQQGFRVRPDKKRYQIYFFNSCSSYTYYNELYFKRKSTPTDRRGTRNLDILTNGLATYFSLLGETDLKLVEAIQDWALGRRAASYQELAREIDTANLFGVNGDEDNPTTPPRP